MSSIHPLANVRSRMVGVRARMGAFVVVMPTAVIGSDCDFSAHVFVGEDVIIGDRVTVRGGVQFCAGLRIEDDVFVGPNVSFATERFSRGGEGGPGPLGAVIEAGARLGAGSVILPGLTVGRMARVEAGAVVTGSVPANAIVVGNPARIVGYVDTGGPETVGARVANSALPLSLKVCGVSVHELPKITDLRGSLSVGEFERTVPFSVKRYFVIFDVPSAETRGAHAHRQCHQFLICITGSCAVVVDDGVRREEIILDRPELGLHIPPMVWGIQYKYSPGAIMLVFASEYYDADDYIRNYDEFAAFVGARA